MYLSFFQICFVVLIAFLLFGNSNNLIKTFKKNIKNIQKEFQKKELQHFKGIAQW